MFSVAHASVRSHTQIRSVFSDFDSLLLRARALVMTGDEVWYLLLKAKQDVRFSFLRKTAMSTKRRLKVGKKQHVGEPQFGRSA